MPVNWGDLYWGEFYWGELPGPLSRFSGQRRAPLNSDSTIIMANPGWYGERHVRVGNLAVGWRVNGAGRLSCHMAARDAHALGFDALLGRWVWWSGPTGAWAGIVEDVNADVSTGIVELSCTDMGSLLDLMITPRTYRQTSSSPGALIGRAIRDSGVDSGSWFTRMIIDEDGAPVTIEWRGEQTSNVVRLLANRAGGQWYVAIEADKSLTFTYRAIPRDMRGSLLLVEGLNVLSGSIRPGISNMVNDLLGVANDRDWQRAGAARAINQASVRLYDRRRATKRYQGHTGKASLETVTRADVDVLSVPSGPVSLDMFAGDRTVTDLRIGDLVTLWSRSQNRVYDLTMLGLAEDTNRGTITVVGSVVESET